jgi:hypothetical protein
MATFNNSGAYSILNTQKGTYYAQGGHYFAPATFVDLGTTAPTDYQSLSSERSDAVNISGGLLNGVTIGAESTINAPIGGPITGATMTGSTIDGTPIGQSTPAAGAFLGLNATSASILGTLSAEGINSTSNGQAASPTNTGTTLSQTFASITYFDSARTANNRTADFLWTGGSFAARFKNDAGSSALTWLAAAGGQAAGITGITSNSGSGSWAHTGAFSASGAINSSVGLTIKEGANAKQGIATLVAGTVTVSNTSVTANSRIQLTVQSLGTVTSPKAVAITARTAGTSFTITSADNTDTSIVAYEIFEPGT